MAISIIILIIVLAIILYLSKKENGVDNGNENPVDTTISLPTPSSPEPLSAPTQPKAPHSAEIIDSFVSLKSEVKTKIAILTKVQTKADAMKDNSEVKEESVSASSETSFLINRLDQVLLKIDSIDKTEPVESLDAEFKRLQRTFEGINKELNKVEATVRSLEIKMQKNDERVVYEERCLSFFSELSELNYDRSYYVQYSCDNSSKLQFPLSRFPQKGCKIKLPVKGRNSLRGVCEESFCKRIKELNLSQGFYDDISLIADVVPYEPDLAFIMADKGILLDIEIDEPYEGVGRKPIHYRIDENGTIDDIRNIRFTERGWSVIRFSEKQIFEQPNSCLKRIFEVLNKIDNAIIVPACLRNEPDLIAEDVWTSQQAKEWANKNYRENLLGISQFYKVDSPRKIAVDYPLGKEVEKQIVSDKDKVLWEKCQRENKYEEYLNKTSVGNFKKEAEKEIERQYWEKCKLNKTFESYLYRYPNGYYSIDAKRLKKEEQEKKEADANAKRRATSSASETDNARKREAYTYEHVVTPPASPAKSSRGYA